MIAPRAMAGAETDDWHEPLTVRVDKLELIIPAEALAPAPPITLPVTKTVALAAVMLIPCALLLPAPPVTVPVTLTVAPPVTVTPALLFELPPVTVPVMFSVPVPLALIPTQVPNDPPVTDPRIFSVPEDENATIVLLVKVAVWFKVDTTIADAPGPRFGVVIAGVSVPP